MLLVRSTPQEKLWWWSPKAPRRALTTSWLGLPRSPSSDASTDHWHSEDLEGVREVHLPVPRPEVLAVEVRETHCSDPIRKVPRVRHRFEGMTSEVETTAGGVQDNDLGYDTDGLEEGRRCLSDEDLRVGERLIQVGFEVERDRAQRHSPDLIALDWMG